MFKDSNKWRMIIKYRTHHGAQIKRDYLEEISDAQGIIDKGPHFDTIIKIEIDRINHNSSPALTVEEAREL